jgi:hypothetical protein
MFALERGEQRVGIGLADTRTSIHGLFGNAPARDLHAQLVQ